MWLPTTSGGGGVVCACCWLIFGVQIDRTARARIASMCAVVSRAACRAPHRRTSWHLPACRAHRQRMCIRSKARRASREHVAIGLQRCVESATISGELHQGGRVILHAVSERDEGDGRTVIGAATPIPAAGFAELATLFAIHHERVRGEHMVHSAPGVLAVGYDLGSASIVETRWLKTRPDAINAVTIGRH